MTESMMISFIMHERAPVNVTREVPESKRMLTLNKAANSRSLIAS